MVDINRAQRIGDQIRKELGRLLLQEIKDRRVQMIAITEVNVSRDLSHAKVYYSMVDNEQDKTEIEQALSKAAGFMRSRLAKELALRTTPKLRFIYDDAMEHGRHMTSIINAAVAEDDKNNNSPEEDSNKET